LLPDQPREEQGPSLGWDLVSLKLRLTGLVLVHQESENHGVKERERRKLLMSHQRTQVVGRCLNLCTHRIVVDERNMRRLSHLEVLELGYQH